jgi:hypothetical protein
MPRVALYNCGYYGLPHPSIDQSLIKVYNDDVNSTSSDTLDNFLLDTTSVKLALVQINGDLNFTRKQLDKLIGCTQVIIKGIEFKSGVPELIRDYDLHNFVFVLNGYLNFKLQHAKVDQDQYWIKSTVDPYIKEWGVHNNLHPYDKKPFMFDVLYGRPKFHRDFVKKKLLTIAEPNWYYEAPFFVGPTPGSQNWTSLNFDRTDFWEDEMEIDAKLNYSCRYRGKVMSISQVLPLKIYNKTAYSIVMETWADNRYSFFTEKIAKPILGCRLFVVISGQHYLRNLRQLGFKTFDGIIDESYDSIQDSTTRWTKAIEQTEWLCQQPQEKILSQIAPIVIHNYAVLNNLRYSMIDQYAEVFLIQNGCASRG